MSAAAPLGTHCLQCVLPSLMLRQTQQQQHTPLRIWMDLQPQVAASRMAPLQTGKISRYLAVQDAARQPSHPHQHYWGALAAKLAGEYYCSCRTQLGRQDCHTEVQSGCCGARASPLRPSWTLDFAKGSLLGCRAGRRQPLSGLAAGCPPEPAPRPLSIPPACRAARPGCPEYGWTPSRPNSAQTGSLSARRSSRAPLTMPMGRGRSPPAQCPLLLAQECGTCCTVQLVRACGGCLFALAWPKRRCAQVLGFCTGRQLEHAPVLFLQWGLPGCFQNLPQLSSSLLSCFQLLALVKDELKPGDCIPAAVPLQRWRAQPWRQRCMARSRSGRTCCSP